MILQAHRTSSRFHRAPGTPPDVMPSTTSMPPLSPENVMMMQADPPLSSSLLEPVPLATLDQQQHIAQLQYMLHMMSAGSQLSPPSHQAHGSVVRKDHFSFTLNTRSSNSSYQITQLKKSVKYSRKVFVGGLPVDVPMDEIGPMFSQFGRVFIDWPQRPHHSRRSSGGFSQQRNSPGYVFLVFEDESSVERLLTACYRSGNGDGHYLLVSSATIKDKPVQVRPWYIRDGMYAPNKGHPLDDRTTVFIGGVPRPTKAKDLANVFESYFGDGSVLFCSIDMDPELDYPKGAARVTFRNQILMMMALKRHFVDLPYMGTTKRVEIKPYLIDEQHCDQCDGIMSGGRSAPYFCQDSLCYQYYCEHCWDIVHYSETSSKNRRNHVVLVRRGDGTQLCMDPPHHLTIGNYALKKAVN
uniref:Cytoplasmic polyadenylation element-binding protein 1 n=1 Tax=Steinernema glaseri TaxID=37863 RepID=A0A1I8AKL4_9BILA